MKNINRKQEGFLNSYHHTAGSRLLCMILSLFMMFSTSATSFAQVVNAAQDGTAVSTSWDDGTAENAEDTSGNAINWYDMSQALGLSGTYQGLSSLFDSNDAQSDQTSAAADEASSVEAGQSSATGDADLILASNETQDTAITQQVDTNASGNTIECDTDYDPTKTAEDKTEELNAIEDPLKRISEKLNNAAQQLYDQADASKYSSATTVGAAVSVGSGTSTSGAHTNSISIPLNNVTDFTANTGTSTGLTPASTAEQEAALQNAANALSQTSDKTVADTNTERAAVIVKALNDKNRSYDSVSDEAGLRQALAQKRTGIRLEGNINLSDDLTISYEDCIIDLAGYTISGIGQYSIIIENGSNVASGTFSTTCGIKNGTITQGDGRIGGAVRVNENVGLVMSGVTLSRNTATYGGAVGMDDQCKDAFVELDGCTLDANTASSQGGAVYVGRRWTSADGTNYSTGFFKAVNTQFTNNSCDGDGGAVFVKEGEADNLDPACKSRFLGDLFLSSAENKRRDTLAANLKEAVAKGTEALADGDTSTIASIVGSEASQNCYVYGWGLFQGVKCSFSGNKASDGGGAIYNEGKVELNDCSVTGNSASENGGGICNDKCTGRTCPTIPVPLLGSFIQQGVGVMSEAKVGILKLYGDNGGTTISNNYCGTEYNGGGVYANWETHPYDKHGVTTTGLSGTINIQNNYKSNAVDPSGAPKASNLYLPSAKLKAGWLEAVLDGLDTVVNVALTVVSCGTTEVVSGTMQAINWVIQGIQGGVSGTTAVLTGDVTQFNMFGIGSGIKSGKAIYNLIEDTLDLSTTPIDFQDLKSGSHIGITTQVTDTDAGNASGKMILVATDSKGALVSKGITFTSDDVHYDPNLTANMLYLKSNGKVFNWDELQLFLTRGVENLNLAADLKAKSGNSQIEVTKDTNTTTTSYNGTSQSVKTMENEFQTLDLKGHTIDANGSTVRRIFLVDDDAKFKIMDSTGTGKITGGDCQSGESRGSVVYVDNGGTLAMDNVTVTGNKADSDGGAIFGDVDSTLIIANSRFTNNTAGGNGGAICLYKGGVGVLWGTDKGAKLTVSGTSFSGNTSNAVKSDFNGGGAVYVGGGVPACRADDSTQLFGLMNASGCTFTDNYATAAGGAIYDGGKINLKDCTITGNTTPWNGGAIYCMDVSNNVGGISLQGKCSIKNNRLSYGSDNNVYLCDSTGCQVIDANKLTAGAQEIRVVPNTSLVYQLVTSFNSSDKGIAESFATDNYGYPIATETVGNYTNVSFASSNGSSRDVDSWDGLEEALNDRVQKITLTGDCNAYEASWWDWNGSNNLYVKQPGTVINLNGHTINAKGLQRALEIEASGCSIVSGRIINGYAGHGRFGGGAVYVDTDYSLSMSGVEISDSKAVNSGGAIFVDHNAQLNLNQCVIHNNNSGDDGGGIYLEHGTSNWYTIGLTNRSGGVLTAVDTEFYNNVDDGGSGGGAIYVGDNAGSDASSRARCSLKACSIHNNAGRDGSGGAGIYNVGILIMEDCQVMNNWSDGNGGGISCPKLQYNQSFITLGNNSITNNMTSGNKGGGIYLAASGLRGTEKYVFLTDELQVTGNKRTVGSNPIEDNLHLSATETVSTGGEESTTYEKATNPQLCNIDDLSGNASKIGVSTDTTSNDEMITVNGGNLKDNQEIALFSDDNSKHISSENNVVHLAYGAADQNWIAFQKRITLAQNAADDAAKTVTLNENLKATTYNTSLKVSGNVIIDLNGHTIDGANLLRVFYISGSSNCTIKNGTITNGTATGTTRQNIRGGAIYVDDINKATALTLEGMTFKNNKAAQGGAVAINAATTLAVTGTTFDGNSAVVSLDTSGAKIDGDGDGGALYVIDNAKAAITMDKVTATSNTADSSGGAVSCTNAALTLKDSTISNNQSGNDGGGIYSNSSMNRTTESSYGTLKTTGSTNISGNRSAKDGGGIYNVGNLVLTGTTSVSGNTSAGYGGGICNKSGGRDTLSAQDTTSITGNKSGNDGGGIYVGAKVIKKMDGTLVSTADTIKPMFDISGTMTVQNNTKSGAANNLCLTNNAYIKSDLDKAGLIASHINISLADGAVNRENPAVQVTLIKSGKIYGYYYALFAKAFTADGGSAFDFIRPRTPVDASYAVLKGTKVTTWKDLQKAIDAGTNRYINVGANLTANTGDQPITIKNKEDSPIVIDFNSHTIDANGKCRAFEIQGNVTIENGTITGGSNALNGGAVKISGTTNDKQVNIKNIAFVNNTSESVKGSAAPAALNAFAQTGAGAGGALFNDHSKVAVSDCSFSGNKAYTGGAIYNSGSDANLVITNTSLTNNAAQAGTVGNASGIGGAIYNSGNIMLNSRVAITKNMAAIQGGGIYNDAGGQVIAQQYVKLTGNVLTGTAQADNLYLAKDTCLSTASLLGSSKIGITAQTNTGILVKSDKNTGTALVSDNEDYQIDNVLAGTAYNTYLLKYRVDTWAELQEAIANGSKTIQLKGDLTAASGQTALNVTKNRITIDLNNYTLDGGGLTRVINLSDKVTGITIQNGTITGGKADNGAAVQTGTGSEVTLTKVSLTGNTADKEGGAVYSLGTVNLNQCTLSDNTAAAGGAIRVLKGATVNLDTCDIQNNKAIGGNGGGAENSGIFHMTGGSITNNSATGNGGGLDSAKDASLALIGSVSISDNTLAGGAANNLYLPKDSKLIARLITGGSIGITAEDTTRPLQITETSDKDMSAYFVSDAADAHITSQTSETGSVVYLAEGAAQAAAADAAAQDDKTADQKTTDEAALADSLVITCEGVTYGETPQPLTVGSVGDRVVTYQYSPAAKEVWSDAVPTEPGDYLVKGILAKDATHDAVQSEAVAFTISKAQPQITGILSASSITKAQAITDSVITGKASVEGTFSWQNPGIKVTDPGSYAFSVLFTPADTAHYDTLVTQVALLVTEKEQTIKGVIAADGTSITVVTAAAGEEVPMTNLHFYQLVKNEDTTSHWVAIDNAGVYPTEDGTYLVVMAEAGQTLESTISFDKTGGGSPTPEPSVTYTIDPVSRVNIEAK